MNANETLIHQFYTAFQNRDYRRMQECYADNATFSDPVFVGLDAKHVRAMWEMFCTGGTELRIEFTNVRADERSGSGEWTAYYKFSATGNNVVNRIKAHFIFENGRIVEHRDEFGFYRWARQALGMPGFLLGWTPLIRNKVRARAKGNLEAFMAKNP